MRPAPLPARSPAVIGLLAGMAANAGVILAAAQLRGFAHRLPVGTEIRPMSTAVIMVGMCLLGLFLALPFSSLALALSLQRRSRLDVILAVIGIALALVPRPLARMLVDRILTTTGTQFAP
jgi:hypothetical protein